MEETKRLFSDAYLKKLIVPLIFEQTLAITVGMADTMMVSSVGEAAVSGVSLVDQINNLMIAVLAAVATGGAVVAAQYLGAKQKENACRSAKQLLYTLIFFGIVLMAVSLLLRKQILRLFFGSIDDNVMQAALIYFVITGLSFPFLAIYNAGAALFRSMGNSNISLRISLIMNIINIAGNAICVFALHMGVAGVAVPSLVSRGVAAVIVTILLLDTTLPVHYEKERFHLDGNMIQRILSIGIPSGIENGIFELGRVIVVSLIATFGTVQIAANGVANNLDGVGCIIGKGMSLAMITVIGQCVGARDEEQIQFYTKKLMKITYIGTFLLDITILIFLKPLLSIYGLRTETLHLAWILVMIHNGCAILLWPLSFVLPNMLRACNDVRYTMVVSLASMFINRIVFSWILGLHFGMGAIGVWIAMIIDWICRIVFFVGRYKAGTWKKTMYRLS